MQGFMELIIHKRFSDRNFFLLQKATKETIQRYVSLSFVAQI